MRLVPKIYPIKRPDMERFWQLFPIHGPTGIAARDLLHAAVKEHHGISRIILAGAPADSAGAVLAGPVFGLALMCDVGMVGIALVAAARLAAGTWRRMDPGQRRTVLLGVGAWLLWRGFWRKMRRTRAG
jgi:hypothetical protein